MSKDQDFLLYPLDTGEDPVCLGCGALMTVAAHEARETKPDSSPSGARTVEGRRSFSVTNSETGSQHAERIGEVV
jgi:hypothetical protein